tara:strand:+ start:1528 stop:2403 length:876 start_codon:yes stop_codon:yes gene_type:complete
MLFNIENLNGIKILTLITFAILLLVFAFLAGMVGSLTGLGGGIIVIPVLVILFHVDIHFAMGAALISVIATSSGATVAYLREGYTNIRIGMFLETAAVLGAFVGALLISVVPKNYLAILFSIVLFISAFLTIRRHEELESYDTSHPWAKALNLDGSFPHKGKLAIYHVQHAPLGLFIMGIAGMLSGLLGIGSGSLKVLAMDQALRLPYKVATTTSNFMIGMTAATSAGVYFAAGYVNPVITFPVVIGVFIGSFLGARLLPHIKIKALRIGFSIVICYIGLQMLYQTLTGQL